MRIQLAGLLGPELAPHRQAQTQQSGSHQSQRTGFRSRDCCRAAFVGNLAAREVTATFAYRGTCKLEQQLSCFANRNLGTVHPSSGDWPGQVIGTSFVRGGTTATVQDPGNRARELPSEYRSTEAVPESVDRETVCGASGK